LRAELPSATPDPQIPQISEPPAAAGIAHQICGPKAGRSRLPACISNAGLAVLVRDLVEPETFEVLFGPWREVMHH
jgi:hypothetical protein